MTEAQPRRVSRTKTMEITPLDGDRFRFLARLTDAADGGDPVESVDPHVTIHDFGLEGEVSGPDLILTELQVHAYSHPYRECPFVLPTAQKMVGRSVLSGWRRSVLDELRGVSGCTHVTTLLLGLGELSTMAIFLQINESIPYTPQNRSDGTWTRRALEVAPGLGGGICFGLRDDGEARSRTHPRTTE